MIWHWRATLNQVGYSIIIFKSKIPFIEQLLCCKTFNIHIKSSQHLEEKTDPNHPVGGKLRNSCHRKSAEGAEERRERGCQSWLSRELSVKKNKEVWQLWLTTTLFYVCSLWPSYTIHMKKEPDSGSEERPLLIWTLLYLKHVETIIGYTQIAANTVSQELVWDIL